MRKGQLATVAERYIQLIEPHVMTGLERFLITTQSKLVGTAPKQTGRVQWGTKLVSFDLGEMVRGEIVSGLFPFPDCRSNAKMQAPVSPL